MAGSGALTAILFFSLIFSSAVISYFVVEMQINEQIPQITLPTLGGGNFNQEQNFITGSYDEKTLVQYPNSWSNELGRGISTSSDNAYLMVNNLALDSNNEITNHYVINNSGMKDYWIVIDYTGGGGQNILVVEDDGFRVRSVYPSGGGYFMKFIDANKFTHPTIDTTYNKNTHQLNFAFNKQLFSTSELTPEDDNIEMPIIGGGMFERYYAGVGANDNTFALEKFSTSNPIQGTTKSSDMLTYFWSFLQTMVLVTLWTVPESIMPTILNLILIKSQLAALVISIVFAARG